MELIAYLKTHGVALVTLSYLLMLAADIITSLTPTKKDDLLLERISKFHKWILQMVNVPNVKREGGNIIIPEGLGVHKPGDKAPESESKNV